MDRERYIDCCRCQKVCPMQLYANEIVEKAGLHQLRQMHRGLSQRGTELLIRKADLRFGTLQCQISGRCFYATMSHQLLEGIDITAILNHYRCRSMPAKDVNTSWFSNTSSIFPIAKHLLNSTARPLLTPVSIE